jgi:predicted short-subunit dehydrogenase-like oxidoreductase (DUF2520 family)
MTFGILGTGNMAWFLGTRLIAAGHTCIGICSRNIQAAAELAGKLNSRVYASQHDIQDGGMDALFLAISDSALSEVASQFHFEETVLNHTAGSASTEALAAAAQHYAVIWPIYSISKNDLPAHRNIPCAWEASDEKAKTIILQVANALTDVCFEARYEQRKWLHLTAVIGNNFVNHLVGICEQICKDSDVPFSMLLPILDQTISRLQHASPLAVQTGPAKRHDTMTIDKQIAMLKDHPDWQQIYESITASIQNTYR